MCDHSFACISRVARDNDRDVVLVKCYNCDESFFQMGALNE